MTQIGSEITLSGQLIAVPFFYGDSIHFLDNRSKIEKTLDMINISRRHNHSYCRHFFGITFKENK